MTQVGKGLAGCLSILVVLPVSGMLNGYALSVLWGWFVVPVFHVPLIGIAEASGISLVVGMMTHQDTATDKDRDWWIGPLITILRPLMALLLGAIWKAFL